jgi:hypothetical protein
MNYDSDDSETIQMFGLGYLYDAKDFSPLKTRYTRVSRKTQTKSSSTSVWGLPVQSKVVSPPPRVVPPPPRVVPPPPRVVPPPPRGYFYI